MHACAALSKAAMLQLRSQKEEKKLSKHDKQFLRFEGGPVEGGSKCVWLVLGCVPCHRTNQAKQVDS